MRKKFSTRLCYPNPFQPSGVEFDLHDTAHVTVEVIDEAGFQLETLVNEKLYQPGTYSVNFNRSTSIDRVLYCRIIVGNGKDRHVEIQPVVPANHTQGSMTGQGTKRQRHDF